ncbi:YchJ family protein [Simiduia litorea]|uniref:YchJ family protein n=1 Tax=Simiduia litorea TaxID=1435348 RepID=UPI0036F1DBE2
MLPKDCPCCSGHRYPACCRPIHDGAAAASPDALMRSRFSAHALGLLDYILLSWAESARAGVDQLALKGWLEQANFGQLQVLSSRTAGASGEVEFIAWYRQGEQLHALHDLSHFIQENGHWRYLNSSAPQLNTPKLGRNDPCPCGSGKKHKQCCINRVAIP